MRNFLFFLFVTCFSAYGLTQKECWYYGFGEGFPRYGLFRICWDKTITQDSIAALGNWYLSDEASFFGARDSNIACYNNGCRVLYPDKSVVLGIDTLNPGSTYNNYCPEFAQTYPSALASVFMEDRAIDSIFYLVHKNNELEFISGLTKIYSNNLVIKKFFGKPEPYKYEDIVLTRDEMSLFPVTVIADSSYNSWWLIQHVFNSNKYYVYNIKNDKIDTLVFETGPILSRSDNSQPFGNQLCYSETRKEIIFSINRQRLLVFHFDNASGFLSFKKIIKLPKNKADSGNNLGAFSPNNRFFYFNDYDFYYQLDLDEADSSKSLVMLDSLFETDPETGWPYQYGESRLGPDCKIYVTPAWSKSQYLHVVMKPNLKGKDCLLINRAVKLKGFMDRHFANFPDYRQIYGCDSSIIFPNSVSNFEPKYVDEYERRLKVFPNPGSDLLQLNWYPIDENLIFEIYSIDGNKMMTLAAHSMQEALEIDISRLPKGSYFIREQKVRIVTAKFMVIR
jgi:hypothetical protein